MAIKKYRQRRPVVRGGMGVGGPMETRVFEAEEGSQPIGSVVVPEETELHDWRPEPEEAPAEQGAPPTQGE